MTKSGGDGAHRAKTCIFIQYFEEFWEEKM